MLMLIMKSLMARPRGRPRVNLEFRKLVSGITKRDFSRIGPKKFQCKVKPKQMEGAGHGKLPKPIFKGACAMHMTPK